MLDIAFTFWKVSTKPDQAQSEHALPPTTQGALVIAAESLLPVAATFGLVRSRWLKARWVAALLIGPFAFVATMLAAFVIGVNLGLIQK